VRLVVGLGNPGQRYAATRHNVAWRVLEVLADRWRAADASLPDVYAAWRAMVGGKPVELMRPLTFMNLSGEAVSRWVHENEDQMPDDLLVVSDDVYLPLGAMRLRSRGSSGGHRGLESVEAALGSRDFSRLRIGVGAAPSSAELKEHVLEPFSAAEQPMADEAVGHAADAVECWAAEGLQAAMNRFNRRAGKEVQEP
jgi:peptidyl-tRNA hydrolase, PTH1 family